MAKFISLDETFRNELEAYLKASGMHPTDLGKIVLKNPAFVMRFRKGAAATLPTVDKIRRYMHDHPPEPAVEPSKARETA